MARSHQYAYIDEDFVGPALLCIICRKPFKNPQCAPCNHTFCRECITKWMAERGSSCPACHRPISVGSFSQISELLEYLLGRLFVKCLFCGQTKIRQAEFDDHIARGCPNVQQPRLTYEQLPTSTIQPFLSIFSELLAEIRQLREQSQQQLNQLRKQAADIKRINQRYDQHETMIDELRRQMADNELSTGRFLSPKPLTSDEKIYYDQCKDYYHSTNQPLISVADEVFDKRTEIPASILKLGIDEDCHEFNLREFLHKFCEKLNLQINDIQVKRIQHGSAIIETEIYNKFESNDRKLHLQMIYHKLTEKLKRELGKMKVFFMFFGPVQTLLKMQEGHAKIRLNPTHNRIYARGHVYWENALSDARDRGDKPYYCPVGWQRSSFYVTEKFYEKFKGWCICYHGTKFQYGLSILLTGLKPAKIIAHGQGIYATPSINYACHPRYAEVKKIPSASRQLFKSGKYVQFVLECRVHPKNIKKVGKETLGAQDTSIDPNISNSIIEWLVDAQGKDTVDFNDPDASIVCSGILIRITDKHPGLLPESEWWHKAHLCDRSKCCALDIDLESLKKEKHDGEIAKILFTE